MRLGDLALNFDSRRVPIKTHARIAGPTPYYGASGVIDYVDGYTHDGVFLLVSEDGENLRSRANPIAFLAEGRIWVNNHAHVLQGRPGVADTAYLRYLLENADIAAYLSGTAQPKLSRSSMDSIELQVPDLIEQRAIAEVLGALDDKIAANDRVVDSSDQLADALLLTAAGHEVRRLDRVATVTMGSSPPGTSYNERGDGLPFYQGVRDFGTRSPSRRVWTTAPVRLADADDTLLSVRAPVGRTNLSVEACCIGRGLAAVKSLRGHTFMLYYALRVSQAWMPYEAEGTVFGSINKAQLANVEIPMVPEPEQDRVEAQLSSLGRYSQSLLAEIEQLKCLRDALIPALMSGRLSVKAAEQTLAEVV